jgi:trans-2,3-dihydro-3-hydroxyanthranilate isomerase
LRGCDHPESDRLIASDRRAYLADAFTDRPFSGNPAGVVTEADGLSDEQMGQIARELGQTESCFVLRPDAPDAEFRLRWFTPVVEVDLCAHATIAAYVCLVREGRISVTSEVVAIQHQTRRGTLGVWVRADDDGRSSVLMSVGVAPLREAPDGRESIARTVGLSRDALDPALPVAIDDASARVIVPVRRLADLLELRPALNAIREYSGPSRLTRFTLFSRETIDPGALVHVRHFAPANGIPEDPVTGTAHGVLAAYLDWLGELGDRREFAGEQGHALGRPGRVIVHAVREHGRLIDVRVGGTAVVVAELRMFLP